MATRNRVHPARSVILLAVITALLFGGLGAATKWSDGQLTPSLALDLEGGTQLILQPTAEGSEVTEDQIAEAIRIMRQRVDASGVAEAEITSQGGQNIVVALPGNPTQETLDLVRRSAQMRFRVLLTEAGPGPIDPSALEALEDPEAADEEPAQEPADPADFTEAELEEAARTAADQDGDGELSDEPATEPTSASDTAWITEQVLFDFYRLNCTDPANLVGAGGDDPDAPLVACAEDGTAKYILGPSELAGTDIENANSGLYVDQQGNVTNEYIVQITFNDAGGEVFSDITERLAGLAGTGQNRFAMVLDRLVISSPSVDTPIPGGEASIQGSAANPFTQEETQALANQLNFGALPITFEVQSQDQISATLGAQQLERGIIAGLIGLVLVVFYSLLQYRGLGLVTMASLLMAGALTYGAITGLSSLIGYRLSLAGVAGLIVAIGITADSFIVYFERIRDEVREGRRLEDAVDLGWARAQRTILASDAVNLLAAVVLYSLAVGGVRGFAFTLGLTTLIDVLVVFLFTHPMMQLLVRTRFFGGGHRLSGLDPEHLGSTVPLYRGRGRVRTSAEAPTGGQTIAERRRAAELAARAEREQQSDPDASVQGEHYPPDPDAATDVRADAAAGPSTKDGER
ncbi:protein translocase subunit SecD [Ruania halotolerans]|uniref:protein translocase subunit SecD n=1 Tax=Ruania halotolerans TaxID=2897773 RepID=UPI001E5B3C9F|nr:protein translocase subunit SecD [Ruania halotolerans]UFU04763.1 protein translocase subunit SecD [Ruania halotolerans]